MVNANRVSVASPNLARPAIPVRGGSANSLKSFVAVGFGVSLALTLQTRLRGILDFDVPIGAGELGLAFFAGLAILFNASRFATFIGGSEFKFTALFGAWVLFLLTPVTFIMSAYELPGSSMRDLGAYFFAFLATLGLALQHDRFALLAKSFIGTLLVTLTLQYFFGGQDAWYYGIRFTGGAENPNQLALYLVGAEVLTVIYARYK